MSETSSPEAPITISLPPLGLANRADQHLAFGLVSIYGILPADLLSPASVQVSVANHRRTFDFEACIRSHPAGHRWVVVNLMTHLLPDGPAQVRIALRWPDGSQVAFPDKSIEIDNSSDLATSVAADLRQHGTPAILPRAIDSAYFPYAQGQTRAAFDMVSPPDVPLSLEQSSSLEAAHRHLERWGFCVLPEVLPMDLIRDFKQQLDAAIETRRLAYEHGSSQRIHGAHQLPAGRKIWLYPLAMQFLKEHFGDDPCACQTLTYVNGSEQNAHQDTIHLTPYPAGFMAGVWIALEDVQSNSGELFVYPGSHRTTRLLAGPLGLEKVDTDYSTYATFDAEIRKLIEAGGYERAVYRPKAGQMLVWHENLIHGGSPRLDRDKTRLSIVSHYFARGAVAYYDSRGEAGALEPLPLAG